MNNKTRYVLGFMFDKNQWGVLLIEKKRPKWQDGKFNGIGGKIEPGENSFQAMRREFKEETGIDYFHWIPVVTMSGEDWEVIVYTCKTNDVHSFKRMEDEEPHYIGLHELKNFDVIPNLDWLIPMCLDVDNINYTITNKSISQ